MNVVIFNLWCLMIFCLLLVGKLSKFDSTVRTRILSRRITLRNIFLKRINGKSVCILVMCDFDLVW